MADARSVYLVQYLEEGSWDRNLEILSQRCKQSVTVGCLGAAEQMKVELEEYFKKAMGRFTTPIMMMGSLFQKKVWEQLQRIPIGETRSYGEVACAIGHPSACRAVAMANRANGFAIVVPCHRVVYQNGLLGGYRGGSSRKEWLLQHERREN